MEAMLRFTGDLDVDDGPPKVVKKEGRLIVLDGTHRITKAYLLGHERVNVSLYDLDDVAP